MDCCSRSPHTALLAGMLKSFVLSLLPRQQGIKHTQALLSSRGNVQLDSYMQHYHHDSHNSSMPTVALTCAVLQLLCQGRAAQQSLKVHGIAVLRLLQQGLLLEVAGHLILSQLVAAAKASSQLLLAVAVGSYIWQRK